MTVFVVTTQDFNHEKPIVMIRYAGQSVSDANAELSKQLSKGDKNLRITLDAVENRSSYRIQTIENESV